MGGPWVRVWLYAAALATGGAFSILFTGEVSGEFSASGVPAAGMGGLVTMLGAAVVALVVGSADRYRFVLLPPVTALYTLLVVYGAPPLFSLSGWRALFNELGADVYEAANLMYVEPIPYDLSPGILVLLLPVVMILIAFSTSATLYEGAPIISISVLGLTIGVLSTISFEAGAGPFFFLFLVFATALLLATGAGDSPGGARGPGWAGVVGGVVVVVFVFALPKLPFSEATIVPGYVDWTRIGTGGTSRLSVQADVGEYLTTGRDAELMRVRSSEPLFWRGGTLDRFDGVRWSDTTKPADEDGEEIASGIPTRTVVQRVQILNAETRLVFGGYNIISASLPSATPNSDGSWSVDRPLSEDSFYRVVSEVPQPTEGRLRSAGVDYPQEVRERFLQRPDDMPRVVSQTAQEIQRRYDTATPYATARAIERYLLYDGEFTYNLDVDYRRADRALNEFLGEEREGFCVQFATSMVLLARELGVPARVVYGTTQGREVESGEYLVTGANVHTWVEVYFPGAGWYPFDPTPGFPVPSAMEANAPRPTVPIAQEGLNPQGPAPQRRAPGEMPPAQQLQEEGQPEDQNSAPREPRPVWPVLVLFPAALVAVPVAKRVLLVRGRPEDLYADLTGRLRDVLPPGSGTIADSPALTPNERMLLLAGAAGVEDGPFREFARFYSDHLYSARTAPRTRRAIRTAHRKALVAYRCLPLWRLVLGSVNPASLLARSGRAFASFKAGLGKSVRGWFSRPGGRR